MKKIALIILAVLISFIKIFPQGAVSGNGQYIASIINKQVVIHTFATKEMIRKIPMSPAPAQAISKVKYNYDGTVLGVFSGNNLYVFNVLNSKQILYTSAKDVVFPQSGDFFIVLKNNAISKYDALSGSLKTNYVFPAGEKVKNIKISNTGKFFALITDKRVHIYDVNTASAKIKMFGQDIEFSKDDKKFTVLYNINDKSIVSVYKTDNFQKLKYLSSSTLLKDYLTQGKKLLPTRSTIGKYGTYVAFYTAKGFNVEIYVFNTNSLKLIWIINNFKNTNNQLYPIHWTAENILIAEGANMMAGEYVVNARTSRALALRMDPLNSSQFLTPDYQKQNLKFSLDYYFAVLETPRGLYVRDTRVNGASVFIAKTKFIGFSPNGKFLYVLKDGVVNELYTPQINKAMIQNIPIKFNPFNRTLKSIVPEKYVADAPLPKGYAYFYVNNTKQIVKLDTAKLHLALRSVKVNGNDVEIQVNLVDRHGNSFMGAADPSWKYIWWNLLLQDPTLKVSQVKNFTVEEKFIKTPTAYALVLDHSGSMGNERANELQYGAMNLINKKIGENAFMLVKFDNKVKLEVPLTKDRSKFTPYLRGTGLRGFGGSTALIDAAMIAAQQLAKNKTFKRKVIILFTDGYENASFFSKYRLLKFVKQNKIEIDVIGFGKQVNDLYLRNLAYATGGIYSHIYKTKALDYIFKDIDIKSRHYYSIKFKTTAKGKHIALVQICQDFQHHDSLMVSFDTKSTQKPLDQQVISPEITRPQLVINKFKPHLVPINPTLKPVTSKKILKDFKNIHFPNILFETGSDKILKNDEKGIDEIVAFMKKYPYVFLEIDGHTDNIGTPEFNLDLSKRRAEAAKRLIVAKGIAPARIITKGFGETKPIASNETEEGRRLNRRIEFKIFVR